MKGSEESELKTKEKDNNILCYVKWITNIFNADNALKVNWDNIKFEKSKKRKWKIKESEQISNEKKKKKNDGISSLHKKSEENISGNIIAQGKSLYNIKSINNLRNKNEFKDYSENYNSISSSSISEIGSEGEGNETENEQIPIKDIKKEEKIYKNNENKLYSNIYDNYNREIQDIKFGKKKYIDYIALSSFINEASFSDGSDDYKNEGRGTDLISYNIFEEIVNKNKELDKFFFDNLNMHDNNDKEIKGNIKNKQKVVADMNEKNNKLVNVENYNMCVKNNLEKESDHKIVEEKLINHVKSEDNNNSANLKLENDICLKKMENNNFCFWNMENETYITRALYANQLKKKVIHC